MEDNLHNPAVAGELLAAEGLAVDLAADGAQALQRLEHSIYDAVLMDLQMPVMDGFDFLRAFEQLPEVRRRGTSVVMLSSSPLDSDRDRALSYASVKDYVVKPLSVQQARSLADRFGKPA